MYSFDKKSFKKVCAEKGQYFDGLHDRLGLIGLQYLYRDTASCVPPTQEEAKLILDSERSRAAQGQIRIKKFTPLMKYENMLIIIEGISKQIIDSTNITNWQFFENMMNQCLSMKAIYFTLPSFVNQINTDIFMRIEATGFMVACKAHELIGYWTAKKGEQYINITRGAQGQKNKKEENISKLKSFIKDKGINPGFDSGRQTIRR